MANGPLAHSAGLSAQPASFARYEHLSDRQLLERFARQHDEMAFAALVRRHGPMVLGVCRRVLRHEQDAEDAFQATFLVLARKACSLEKPELLANFLYGVAYRTAQHARVRAARRCRHEREAASMAAARSDPDSFRQELRRMLDDELHQLPEKYRAPLVLCYLEGKTDEEAARLLGWPVGSMSHRLARGRQLLRDRLTGRLRTAPAALPAVFVTDPLEPAAVPPWLADATVRAALALAGAKVLAAGLTSASVLDLLETTLRSLGTRPRWYLRLFLAVLAALGLSAATYSAWEGRPWNDPPDPCLHSPAPSGANDRNIAQPTH
jgi:RNA polymerase sigma factor (sigma-70 family)